eukprot:TRINITY_DN7334_c0_g1_i1.p1 TRINITY_DN7334_c0_g1~~TRINITY_DN7334_c0_g1_i1.p1  ORF type:complete len:198 (+),score=25.62 TRINITY_DN7334_c0_g1_i1:30-623(+)
MSTSKPWKKVAKKVLLNIASRIPYVRFMMSMNNLRVDLEQQQEALEEERNRPTFEIRTRTEARARSLAYQFTPNDLLRAQAVQDEADADSFFGTDTSSTPESSTTSTDTSMLSTMMTDTSCVVCMERRASIQSPACTHKCICAYCNFLLKKQAKSTQTAMLCPMCRANMSPPTFFDNSYLVYNRKEPDTFFPINRYG